MSRKRAVSRTLAFLLVPALLGGALFAAERPSVKTPVVVELFTSQGCSSCPSADRLLSRLGREGLAGDVEVIPLSFHVDYWNYIGWTDPFSSKAWSDRQRRYARVMRLDTIYTPQLVIQGEAELVGSNAESALRAIARARHRDAAVDVEVGIVSLSSDALVVDIETRAVDSIPSQGLELQVALFEKRLVTPVARGENAARTLENDYVVRVLRPGFEIDARRGAVTSGRMRFELEPGWKRENLGVAAFAQDSATLRIHGAASLPAVAPRP